MSSPPKAPQLVSFFSASRPEFELSPLGIVGRRDIATFPSKVSASEVSALPFDQTGLFANAVLAARVASRLLPELEHRMRHGLSTASREITRNWGGTVPDFVQTVKAKSALPSDVLETTS